MNIKALPQAFSVCKVEDYSLVDFTVEYTFAAKTDAENSLVCPTAHLPTSTTARDDGWRAFRIEGELDFSLIGILAKISALLAAQNIGIFAISTYNTDYILTKAESFEKALAALAAAGYTVV